MGGQWLRLAERGQIPEFDKASMDAIENFRVVPIHLESLAENPETQIA